MTESSAQGDQEIFILFLLFSTYEVFPGFHEQKPGNTSTTHTDARLIIQILAQSLE